MPYAVLIAFGSLTVTALMMILSLLLRISRKLRLTLPVVWFLLISTLLNPWASANERTAWIILIVLCALSVLSWLSALIRWIRERRYEKALMEDVAWQLEQARKRGIPTTSLYIDEQGTLRDYDTREPLI